MDKYSISGYLGSEYQLKVLWQLLTEPEFATQTFPFLSVNNFDDANYKRLFIIIKEYYNEYGKVPNLQNKSINHAISRYKNPKNSTDEEILLSIIERIKTWNDRVLNKELDYDGDVVQKALFTFIKQGEYSDLATFIISKVKKGQINDSILVSIEDKIKKISEIGVEDDDGVDVAEDIDTILDDEFRNPIPTGILQIDRLMGGGLANGEIGIILAPTGIGKAQPLSTPILTPKGWIKMGNIKVNDYVIGSDGKKQKVLNVFPQGKRPIYKIKFSDKTSTFCDEEHLWAVNSRKQRTQKTKVKGKTVYIPDNSFQVLKTKEMINDLKVGKHKNYRLPNIKPIEFDSKEVSIEPYFLGLLLGNSSTEFIPDEYLYNTIDVRQSILQGLLDNDGTITEKGIIIYTTVSENLCKNVRELVFSLGGSCKVIQKQKYYKKNSKGKISYDLTISFPNNGIIPFRLPRKLKYFKYRDKYKFIDSIEYSHDEDAQCIVVENTDSLYVTEDYILTHNSTILTKIANEAHSIGKNVLHIIFEDTKTEIKKKHYAIWSKICLSEMKEKKVEVRDNVKSFLINNKENIGRIILKRFSQEDTTIPIIRNWIDRYKKKRGLKFDIIVLDYLDCVEPHKKSTDQNQAELLIIKAFESMAAEYDIPCWSALQTNRTGIDSEFVETGQMGGNIKRAQKTHFLMSVAKTSDQKEDGFANIKILKARFAKDGQRFEDVIFDNDKVKIEIYDSTSRSKAANIPIVTEESVEEFNNNLSMLNNKKDNDQLEVKQLNNFNEKEKDIQNNNVIFDSKGDVHDNTKDLIMKKLNEMSENQDFMKNE